jgi:hypothetical protein
MIQSGFPVHVPRYCFVSGTLRHKNSRVLRQPNSRPFNVQYSTGLYALVRVADETNYKYADVWSNLTYSLIPGHYAP